MSSFQAVVLLLCLSVSPLFAKTQIFNPDRTDPSSMVETAESEEGNTADASDDEDDSDDGDATIVDEAVPGTNSMSAAIRSKPFGVTSANVALVSDYVVRGQSQTSHQPAIQGGVDWKHPIGAYINAWGSNVRLQEAPATMELDLSAGYVYRVSKSLSASLGVMTYLFFQSGNNNAWEIPLKLNWKAFKVEASYSPHYGAEGSAWYVTAGWADKVVWGIKLGLSAGYSIFEEQLGTENYADFRISVSREILGLDWEISQTFVDHRQFKGMDDPRTIFSVAKSF